MKKLNFVKITTLIGTSIILVGCHSNNNEYENKPVKVVEITKEYSQPTTIGESTTNFEQITIMEPTTEIETSTEISITEPTASIKPTVQMTDDEVIEYIKNISDKMTECSENIADSVKSGFITVVDFLFYDGEIGGRTFDSLKDDAKSTVLGIYDTISTYIEEHLPIWKESLGEKYEQAKELWNDKKDDLSDLWQSGKQKVKNWYENFRDENQN